jgi:hypothetical protein
LHLGVIISGATTFLSSFFAGPPVSFYLAQCAGDSNSLIQFDFLIQPQRLSLSKFSRAHRDSLIALRFIMISSNEEYDSRLL